MSKVSKKVVKKVVKKTTQVGMSCIPSEQVVESEGQAPPVVVTNFSNFAGLKKEFATGKMPEKKRIALRMKLIAYHKEDVLFKPELDLMLLMLRRERAKGELSYVNAYILHSIEDGMCEDECFVRTDDAPQVHHLKKGLKCNFTKDLESERYFVYVPRKIPTEHQIDRSVVLKEQKGHPVDPSEYPPVKILIKRLSLTSKEFDAWFVIEDEDILEDGISPAEAEAFQF